MAFEIPTALIRDLQIRLRRHAGVPSDVLSDPSIPPLPSILDTVTSFDPSLPPSLRCDRCRAGLLRGSHSRICIFCGAENRRDGVSHTISFNSTVACRNLLGSLGLDGSEPVILEPETNGSNKNKEAPKDELILSQLLVLELQCPSDKELVDDRNVKKTLTGSMPAVSLSSVDLDRLFTVKEERDDNVPGSSNEGFIPERQIISSSQSNLSSSSHNFDFSANRQSSDVGKSSVDDKVSGFDDSFADWEADFQSATPESSAVDTKPVELFKNSSGTESVGSASNAISIDQDTKLGHETSNRGNNEPKNSEGLLSMSGNWIPDDFWPTGNSGVSQAAGHFQGASQSDDGGAANHLNDILPVSDGRIQETPWPTSSKDDSNATTAVTDDSEFFDDWQDFTSSGEGPIDVSSSQLQTVGGIISNKQSSLRKSESLRDTGFSDFFPPRPSSESQYVSTSASNEKESRSVNNIDETADFFDSWQDFGQSVKASTDFPNVQAQIDVRSTALDHPLETETENFQDFDFGNISGIQGGHNPSSKKETYITNASDDNLFDNWNNLTSLGEAPGGLLNSKPCVNIGTSVEAHYLSANPTDQRDEEFGDFLHFNSISGSQTSQEGPSEVKSMLPVASVSDRINGAREGNNRNSAGQGTTDANDPFFSASQLHPAEPTVDMLLSQMPDLSFMLADNLSLPKQANSSDLNSRTPTQ